MRNYLKKVNTINYRKYPKNKDIFSNLQRKVIINGKLL